MSEALMTEIYNVFDPFDPPPREAYVDCKAVRGDWNVLTELGRKIIRSKGPDLSALYRASWGRQVNKIIATSGKAD
jgi:hypothetical protein